MLNIISFDISISVRSLNVEKSYISPTSATNLSISLLNGKAFLKYFVIDMNTFLTSDFKDLFLSNAAVE
nr:MAG TPA: hypothetical protein [Caudoviricetes sp.]